MDRWTVERAAEWRELHPWPCGFNYVTSTAVNSTEMWQADTFDAETIDRELGWAADLGLNTCRVFLPFLVWRDDPDGFRERLNRFLAIADRHRISMMPILFDDCAFAGKEPYLGKQDEPVPGVHNSGWTPSPGLGRVVDRSVWPELDAYVADLVGGFAEDDRIAIWDLYNEPGGSDMGEKSLPLAEAVFEWARRAGASQPLTIGLWNEELPGLNESHLRLSDVVSFHCYDDRADVEGWIAKLRPHGRPLICTEWMARDRGSTFEALLPLWKAERVGCYSWGLVQGKTQTYYPWGSPEGAPEPEVWHHDILRPDGTPYSQAEADVIRAHTGAGG